MILESGFNPDHVSASESFPSLLFFHKKTYCELNSFKANIVNVSGYEISGSDLYEYVSYSLCVLCSLSMRLVTSMCRSVKSDCDNLVTVGSKLTKWYYLSGRQLHTVVGYCHPCTCRNSYMIYFSSCYGCYGTVFLFLSRPRYSRTMIVPRFTTPNTALTLSNLTLLNLTLT